MMRIAVIPAQIITVEDKIAGNLSLAQISILIIPLIFTMSIYSVIPPGMTFTTLKILISLCIGVLSLLLAIRIKGKIVLQWGIILLQYQLRPGYYLYNKNDVTQRIIDIPVIKESQAVKQATTHKEKTQPNTPSSIADVIRFEHLLTNPQKTVCFKTTKRGGLTLAVTQVTT